MGLRAGEAVASFEFLQIGRQIEVERRALKPDNLTRDPSLPAIVQMTDQAEAAKLSCNDIRGLADDDVGSGEIQRRH